MEIDTIFEVLLFSVHNLKRVVEETKPHPVRPPGSVILNNFTKNEIINSLDNSIHLVDAVIENLFKSNSDQKMTENQPPTSTTAPINFNPDDQLLRALENKIEDEVKEDLGYKFDPLPIFVMAGIIVCGIIVLAVYCTVRYKILRICCSKSQTRVGPNNTTPAEQPTTSDTSCSEGEQTPKKPGKRPKALQKTGIENPYRANLSFMNRIL